MKPFRKILAASLCMVLVHARAASAAWLQNGVPVSAPPAVQHAPAEIPDGAGGVIVAWEDHRWFDADIYAQRFDGQGNLLWAVGGVAIVVTEGDQFSPQICSDGAGGAIIAWIDQRSGSKIYGQRVDGQGVPQWAPNGIPFVDNDLPGLQDLGIVSDGNGGAITAASYLYVSWRLIDVQRLDAAGVRQWGPSGKGGGGGHAVAIAPDDANGAVLSWTDNVLSTSQIKVDHLDGSGNSQWGGGIALSPASSQADESCVEWTFGWSFLGAIVAWEELRSGGSSFDIYAQVLDRAGDQIAASNGQPVSLAVGDQVKPRIAPSSQFGAILTWEDYRAGSGGDIYAQRIDGTGSPQWVPDGVPVCRAANTQLSPRIVSDGADGAVISWLDHRTGGVDVYAQRVASSGGGLWTINGVPVSTAAGNKGEAVIASDGASSAVVAWAADSGVPANVYAERIEFKYGYWGHPDPTVNAFADVPADQGGHMRVQWQASQQDLAAGGGNVVSYTVWLEGPHPYPWTQVGTVLAAGQTTYSFDVPTLQDWTPSDPATCQVKVIANSIPTLNYSWESNVLAGHSIDNFPPDPCTALTAQHIIGSHDVSLQWTGSAAPDFDHYAVYRSSSPGVTPTASNFIANAASASLVDAGAPSGALYYIVTAIDVHGNESGASNEAGVTGPTGVGDTPSLTVLTVGQNHPNPFAESTELEVGLPRASDISVEIYDAAGRAVDKKIVRDAPAGWKRMTLSGRDGGGRALPSGVYFYRVRAGASTVTRKMVIAR